MAAGGGPQRRLATALASVQLLRAASHFRSRRSKQWLRAAATSPARPARAPPSTSWTRSAPRSCGGRWKPSPTCAVGRRQDVGARRRRRQGAGPPHLHPTSLPLLRPPWLPLTLQALLTDGVSLYLSRPGSEHPFHHAVFATYLASGSQLVLHCADYGCAAQGAGKRWRAVHISHAAVPALPPATGPPAPAHPRSHPTPAAGAAP